MIWSKLQNLSDLSIDSILISYCEQVLLGCLTDIEFQSATTRFFITITLAKWVFNSKLFFANNYQYQSGNKFPSKLFENPPPPEFYRI